MTRLLVTTAWISEDGEAVHDPFLGSGTALIAAERGGCRCHAMELDPVYVEVALRRWERLSGRPRSGSMVEQGCPVGRRGRTGPPTGGIVASATSRSPAWIVAGGAHPVALDAAGTIDPNGALHHVGLPVNRIRV